MSFGMRNFRYIEEIKEALERECPGAVSCSDILVLSAREGVVRHIEESKHVKGRPLDNLEFKRGMKHYCDSVNGGVMNKSLQGIPEAVSESDQRGGCAC
ncbi:unnamed protein product [Prunus armeniaca]